MRGLFRDEYASRSLYRLIRRGSVKRIVREVAAGKESRVYLGVSPDGKPLAVKVYFIESTSFRGHLKYVKGDHRFRSFKEKAWSIATLWCWKEFRNLHRAYRAGVKVPAPIDYEGNVLVMEFVGDCFKPAPTIKEYPPNDMNKALSLILKYMSLLWKKARLVHGDLSEYNILNHSNELYIIDWSAAVETAHPKAETLLLNDLKNIVKFFSRFIETPDHTYLYKVVVKNEIKKVDGRWGILI